MRKVYKTFMVVGMVAIMAVGLYAQAGPSWLPQGNLSGARVIKDIIEIPNTNIVIAVGQRDAGWGYEEPAIWRSTDGGQTWSRWGSDFPNSNDNNAIWYVFQNVVYDSSRNILFTVAGMADYREYQTVWYSTDYGESWHHLSHPDIVGYGDAFYCALYESKLYVIYHQYVGGIHYKAPLLFALDYSDNNPSNWAWYFVRQFPELDISSGYYWGKLAVKDGKLYVIGKDRETEGIRVYTIDLSKVNSTMRRIGTAADMEEYWKGHIDELSEAEGEPRESEGASKIQRMR